MARTVTPLSDSKCESARYTPGGKTKLFDGGGLFLLLKPSGSKSWRMKYNSPNGKEDLLVFGDYPAIGLKAARNLRQAAKELLAKDIDPKSQQREDAFLKHQAAGNTFEAVARDWHSKRASKLSPDYAARMLKRLEDNLFPEIGRRPVSELKTCDLMLPLQKIERREAPVIAERMKQAITGVMRHAVQHGLIDSNPALDLGGVIKTRQSRHRPALPLDRLPELQHRIESYSGRELTRLATRLTLLVFIRSSELRFARWEEIDFDRAMWTIPGERKPIEGVKHSQRGAKMGTPHLVPLSRQAMSVLKRLHELSGRFDLVFPGEGSSGAPLSEGTINKALQRMGYDTKEEVCGHGFRTMACGALVQSGLWQEDAVERQMSHQERNGVRQAYVHQAEYLQERRLMMQWWADFLETNRQKSHSPYDFGHPTADSLVTLKAV